MHDLYNIRYYALGHSFLRHGVFNGWEWPDPEKGPRGMAASSFEKDYFARFQYYLKENFTCCIEAAAENIAVYERLCVDGAKKEDYIYHEYYKSTKQHLETFNPNLVTVFVGGGNTIANDYKNISVFFDTLFELIKNTVKKDTVVIAVNHRSQNEDVGKACLCYAQKYNFAYCDVSFIRDDTSRKNPYYAFMQYPEYDKFIDEFKKQNGSTPVEFRTHPSDFGMDAIGRSLFDIAAPLIQKNIKPISIPQEEYIKIINEKHSETANQVVKKNVSDISTKTDRFDFNIDDFSEGVVFGGFNVFVKNSFLCGNSAPGTSFNIYHNKLSLKSNEYNAFIIKMNIRHSSEQSSTEYFDLTITSDRKAYKYTTTISFNELKEYIFDISDVSGTITGFNITPTVIDCNADIDYIYFKKIY